MTRRDARGKTTIGIRSSQFAKSQCFRRIQVKMVDTALWFALGGRRFALNLNPQTLVRQSGEPMARDSLSHGCA